MKQTLLIVAILCAWAPFVRAQEKAKARPNIVWIFTEDMNDWMGCYGDKTVPTPNIDALATRGVRFDRMYMPAGVCSATRSAIATGAMQTSLGIHNHRSSRKRAPSEVIHLPDGVKTMYEVLRAGGYYVITQGMNKSDFNFIWDSKSLYEKSGKKYDEPLWQGRKKGQPFFAQIQLKGGKNSGQYEGATKSQPGPKPAKKRKGRGSRAIHTDASKVIVPPYYPDHAAYRNAIAHHYDTIRQTDDEVGKIIAALKADNLLENTIIFFWTDHGMLLPRHKQWLYEGGIRVPFVAAGPGLKAGTARSDLASGIDITATTLGLARIALPKWMEGRDFFAKDHAQRDFVVSARDRCDYTIERVRAITTKRYKYLRNFLTDRPFMQPQYRDGRDFMVVGKKLFDEGKLNPAQAFIWQPKRTPEELYDLEADPHEIKNLASDPAHAEALAKHRKILADWIKATDDKGQYPESAESLKGVLKRWNKQAVNPEYDKARQ